MSARWPWLERRSDPPVARVLLAPLAPLAWLYAAGAALHRAFYEQGLVKRVRLPCKVVSVGNLGVGGSGKTPAAAWVASALRRRGYRVALASRGYGGSASGVEVVSDGRYVLGRAEVVGEEPMWLAGSAPGVPVLVARRREQAGYRAISLFGAEVIVLDDGFQHHRLARDVELVAVPGGAGFGNARVLPRGPLREGPRALSRAHALLEVDGPLAAQDDALLRRYAPRAKRFAVRRTPAWLRPLAGGERSAASALSGRRVGMLCGIARPSSFRATLEALGAEVVATRAFPDHHRFSRNDLSGLARDATLWVTTEKDAGKLPPAWTEGADVRVLGLETSVADAESFLDWLESRLHPRPAGTDASVPKPVALA